MAALGPRLNKEFWLEILNSNTKMDRTFWLELTQSSSKNEQLKLKDIGKSRLMEIRESLDELSEAQLIEIFEKIKSVELNEQNKDLKIRFKHVSDIAKELIAPKLAYNNQLLQTMSNDFNEYKKLIVLRKPTFKQTQFMRIFEHNMNGYKDDPRLNESVKKEAARILEELPKLKPPPVPPRKTDTQAKEPSSSPPKGKDKNAARASPVILDSMQGHARPLPEAKNKGKPLPGAKNKGRPLPKK